MGFLLWVLFEKDPLETLSTSSYLLSTHRILNHLMREQNMELRKAGVPPRCMPNLCHSCHTPLM